MAVVFATLPRHGARPLRSTETEAEAVLAVALPLAVTTWASAVLAVTTSAVLDVLALKPFGHIVPVLDAVITPTISYTQLRRIDPTLSQRTSTRIDEAVGTARDTPMGPAGIGAAGGIALAQIQGQR